MRKCNTIFTLLLRKTRMNDGITLSFYHKSSLKVKEGMTDNGKVHQKKRRKVSGKGLFRY